MKSLFVTAALGLGLSVAACASGSSETVVDRSAYRYDEHVTEGAKAPDRNIYLQDRVADLCDIPRTATFFEVGSAGGEQIDRHAIHRVADCMRDGALKTEKVVIIGYTDPRGSEKFNERLGLERAESVAAALVAEGVERDRVFITSYGESKATDSMSEKDMARDRRVTLRVAQPR